MKKFKFSLEKLLNFKQSMLDKEKNTLSLIQAEKKLFENQLEKLNKKICDECIRFDMSISNGEGINMFNQYRTYINELKKNAESTKFKIRIYESKVQAQREIVINYSKDVSGLEKLKDKQKEEYNKDVNKKEQEIISEFVSLSYINCK